MPKLPDNITRAIKSGPVPRMRQWRRIKDLSKLTDAEKVMKFAEAFLVIGEGEHAGKPLRLAKFQEAFIYAVLDNPVHTRMAILSVARRNGKTFLTAAIALAALCGPISHKNAVIASAALSRDQAALIFRSLQQFIDHSPALQKITRVIPSSKRIVCLTNGSEYYALSAEAKTNLGRSIRMLILDESGAIADPASDFVSMLRTSQGSYDRPYFITISTQAPADASYLSQEIDRAERDSDPATVAHVYAAPDDADLEDENAWAIANPGIADKFRSVEDIREQAKKAKAIPAQESGFRNLILNQRVSQESIWLAPSIWKENAGAPDESVFMETGVHIGLDLSQKNDLTCAVIAAEKDGVIHVKPFAFTPMEGIEDRSRRDRVPYDQWARDGVLTAVPGKTIDYEWVAQFLKMHLDDEGIEVLGIHFDRWRINEFRAASGRVGFAGYADWKEVGMGYKDVSPRVEAMETALLQGKIRHGLHPVLNLGAASAIAVSDPTGSRKLDKTKASQKIDAIVAMLMAIYPLVAKTEQEFDVAAMIG